MIYIYYSTIKESVPEYRFSTFLSKLPVADQTVNAKFHQWHDRCAHLYGRLLLLTALKNFGYADGVLNQICYSKYSRPYLNDDIDFNISHSGEYVLCAIGQGVRLGVDVEKIRTVNFDDFKSTMTPEEWYGISSDAQPMRAFFKYWSIKESVVKANGCGLSVPLQNIRINGSTAECFGEKWYLNHFLKDENYSTAIACNKDIGEIEIQLINFWN